MNIDKVKLPEGYDRRKKLDDKARADIIFKYKELGHSLRQLGREYNVDKTAIKCVINPEFKEQILREAKARRADGRYKQSAEKRKEIMREYRAHKRQALIEVGQLDKDGKPVIVENGSQLFKK